MAFDLLSLPRMVSAVRLSARGGRKFEGMTQGEHILVVDDDPRVRAEVERYLSEEGYRVSLAVDGPSMQAVLERDTVDLIILDVRLPGENGLQLTSELRSTNDSGIIMVSRRDDLADRVAGLEVGADDYIGKPFDLRELLARVRSVLRRRASPPPLPEQPDQGAARLRFGGFQLDQQRRALTDSNGNLVELTAGEFDLLLAFAAHPNKALSRDQLLDLAHGREATVYDRSIDVQVGRLRRKLEANPRRPELIKTIRGIGYMLAGDVLRG